LAPGGFRMIARFLAYGDDRSRWSPFVPNDWVGWMPLPPAPKEIP